MDPFDNEKFNREMQEIADAKKEREDARTLRLIVAWERLREHGTPNPTACDCDDDDEKQWIRLGGKVEHFRTLNDLDTTEDSANRTLRALAVHLGIDADTVSIALSSS